MVVVHTNITYILPFCLSVKVHNRTLYYARAQSSLKYLRCCLTSEWSRVWIPDMGSGYLSLSMIHRKYFNVVLFSPHCQHVGDRWSIDDRWSMPKCGIFVCKWFFVNTKCQISAGESERDFAHVGAGTILACCVFIHKQDHTCVWSDGYAGVCFWVRDFDVLCAAVFGVMSAVHPDYGRNDQLRVTQRQNLSHECI